MPLTQLPRHRCSRRDVRGRVGRVRRLAVRSIRVLFSFVLVLGLLPNVIGQESHSRRHHSRTTTHAHSSKHASRRKKTHVSETRRRHARTRHHRVTARELAKTHELHRAFVASSQLRPMAQQLIAQRTPQAYAGVLAYARAHTGEAAAAAYMTLGQAYSNDHKYDKAIEAFQQANRAGEALDDYADYLGAQAAYAQQQYAVAQQNLTNFAARHTDSILLDRATLLLANVDIGEGDPQSALRQLTLLKGSSLENSADYVLALGRANQMAGNSALAQKLYAHLYVDYPSSSQASLAVDQLRQMGISQPFSFAQKLRRAENLYAAGQYGVAATAYASLAQSAVPAMQNTLLAKQAIAAYRQSHHVDKALLARISDTSDEAGAIRLYLSMEAARDANDAQQVKALVDQLEQRFPANHWTAEALLSAGNMALLVNDFPTAIQYYGDLARRFPESSLAPGVHWRAAWLNYRLGNKKLAAQQFDEQIARYPQDSHVSAAIYWRGVVYQDVEHNPAAAAAYYRKLTSVYSHYYYADVARQRLADLGAVASASMPALAHLTAPAPQDLTDDVPEDDIHVERAKLLANAGLNQYIAPEIEASADSASWGAYAEAQIYSSYGENWRAMRVLKQKVHSYFAIPLDSIPKSYWTMLFPQPYWPVLQRECAKQGLDPYLVASLIRQESEFNPSVISYANAWGLMQLLPRVGSELARQNHVRPYQTSYLLNPEVNLQLGTIYFKQLMDEFHGQPEYALAAYNAGDNRVKAWLASGTYGSLPEFVESIPFTQTREYVQAILRNREIYRQLYGGKKPE